MAAVAAGGRGYAEYVCRTLLRGEGFVHVAVIVSMEHEIGPVTDQKFGEGGGIGQAFAARCLMGKRRMVDQDDPITSLSAER